MKKSLMLNFQVLEEIQLSISEFLFLTNIYLDNILNTSKFIIDVSDLEKRKFIKIIENNDEKEIILRTKAIELIEFSLIDTEVSYSTRKKVIKKSRRQVENVVDDRINEFRDKWKGLKAGSMGSLKACKVKLSRWMHENPNYTFDKILDAADLYLSTEGLNTRFLQRADYFIFKQENNREESSRLSAFIDDVDANKVQDWTSKLN
tara:strand:- start:66202 stop:66816 length:615 start_codon:yes stop_codon:yes gene_type:complete